MKTTEERISDLNRVLKELEPLRRNLDKTLCEGILQAEIDAESLKIDIFEKHERINTFMKMYIDCCYILANKNPPSKEEDK